VAKSFKEFWGDRGGCRRGLFRDTGLESPVNPQAGKPAPQKQPARAKTSIDDIYSTTEDANTPPAGLAEEESNFP
jgi:hypothetical protein